MSAEEIERTYQELQIGRQQLGLEKQNVLYLKGKTLREFAATTGHTVETTSDGHPIDEEAMYAVTSDSIHLVE